MLTSAHSPFDHRIFHKQAKTLLSAGYDLTLVAHHERAEKIDSVDIVPIPPSSSEFERTIDLFRIYRAAKQINADIYHIHDPTLLPFIVALSYTTDVKTVYDAHEDYLESIQAYSMTPDWSAPFIERFWPTIEKIHANRLDGVIAATEHIADIFRERGHHNVAAVHNFPDVSRMQERPIPIERSHEYVLAYTGGVSEVRGLSLMLAVTALLHNRGYDVSLWLLGPVKIDGGRPELKRRLQREGHDEYVRVLGKVDHSEVYSYQRKADVGLVLVPKRVDGERYYRRGIPTKMVEYMYAELPVVASNTIGIKNYLPRDCGVRVPSQRTNVQADVIQELLDNPKKRSQMGRQGRKHVLKQMSWESESKTLLEFYNELIE